ncbi:FtsX-like permease family protein [Oceanispirochaeta crateris]|uniref:FtsX-like permease family protein n=1 Tax=Oceanispirochaeta crateris TaxID=2518645 RepID=A0A5C1QMM3_9SPIO|nr:FtsX-like permease family protein [Oceanispirochaeta crateris]QEN08210.1 FtsX-like permease family protein [Oceanispirochaeta crateris]
MLNEPFKIIIRRFGDRFLESGLLIIAVALGIGAASSGIALLANTVSLSREILDSPGYKEIVVSTVGDADDMEAPVSLKAVVETAVLTSEDLSAADLAPAVTFAYVKNNSRIHFINEETVAREQERQQRPDGGDGNQPPEGPEGDDRPREDSFSAEDLAEAVGESNIIIAETEESSGYEVTPGYFDAWDTQLVAGSLFSEQDMTGNSSIVVLGQDLADSLLEEGSDYDSLLGRQLLTREGLYSIIGVVKGEEDTDLYYSPYRSRGSGDFRRSAMNTQLRFAVEDPDELDATSSQLQQWFDSQFGGQQLVISNPRSEAQQLMNRNTGIALLIMFLSLSGLFIASVNVSNILVSRAMRMKKHVGILMALGASRQQVSLLFASESLGITLIGALLGTILSLPLARTMQESLDITGGTGLYTLLGVVISMALTLLFGLLPVRQYAKIDPAIAMRAA